MKVRNLPFAVSQRKTNSAWFHVDVESKNTELTDLESRLVVARGRGWGLQLTGECGQRVQISSYEMTKLWGSNVQYGDYS